MKEKEDIAIHSFGEQGEQRRKRFLSWKFSMGRWLILPSLGFWNVRVRQLDSRRCMVSLPYSFWTKNPFRSTYFAALAGAGELSTGALLQCHLMDHGHWSMLVVESKMKFIKKATSTVHFTCQDGLLIDRAIKLAIESGEAQIFTLSSIGKVENEEVCKLEILWSIKEKTN